MTFYTYGTVPVYDPIADVVLENASGGVFVSAKNGTAIPIFDLNKIPVTEIASNGNGMSTPFLAEDVLTGLVQFGELVVTVWANEVGDLALNGLDAVEAATAAQTAAVAAQNSAATSAAAAALVGTTNITTIDNHLGGNATNLVPLVNTKADLVSGTVPLTQLPPGVGSVYRGTVANQAAMLGVSAAKTGDWVIRTDLSARFDLTGINPAMLSHWTQVPGGSGGGGGSPTTETIPAGSLLVAAKAGSTWPARPTARTDVRVAWLGPDPAPTIVSSGTGGAIDNVDVRWRTP